MLNILLLAATLAGQPPLIPFDTLYAGVNCPKLEQVVSIMEALSQGGMEASSKKFKAINPEAAAHKQQVCRPEFNYLPPPDARVRTMANYKSVEAEPNKLYDIYVVEVTYPDGRKRYITKKKLVGKGYSI